MSSYQWKDRVLLGVRRNPIGLAKSTFLAYATLWAIIEPISYMLPTINQYFSGWPKFALFSLFSLTFGLNLIASYRQVTLKHNGSTINVCFGDLFTQNGLRAIPVSRFFFETELVTTSLQSLLIQRFLQSDEGLKGLDQYSSQLNKVLEGMPFDEVSRQGNGQSERRYPIGTTASVQLNEERYVLFALTETERSGHIPPINCSVINLWFALEQFWKNVRQNSRGNNISIPLIGSGVSGLNMPPKSILELNLLALLNALVEGGKITTGEITVILHDKYFDEIDLRSLKHIWL